MVGLGRKRGEGRKRLERGTQKGAGKMVGLGVRSRGDEASTPLARRGPPWEGRTGAAWPGPRLPARAGFRSPPRPCLGTFVPTDRAHSDHRSV